MPKMNHVAAVVRDLESSVKLFSNAFGFAPGPVNEVKSLGIRSCFVKGDNIEVELIQPVANGPYWEFLEEGRDGLNHIALEYEDLDAMVKKLQGAGVRSKPPFSGPTGVVINLEPSTTSGVRIQLFKKK